MDTKWIAFYGDGGVFKSDETNWSELPYNNLQVVNVYNEHGNLIKVLYGDDYFWMDSDGVIQCGSAAVYRTEVPNNMIKQGRMLTLDAFTFFRERAQRLIFFDDVPDRLLGRPFQPEPPILTGSIPESVKGNVNICEGSGLRATEFEGCEVGICPLCGRRSILNENGTLPTHERLKPKPQPEPETVNKVAHYHGDEVQTFIESFWLNFALGNVVKYVARCDLKGDPIENLKKAAWYLDREIKLREEATKAQQVSDLTDAVNKAAQPPPWPKHDYPTSVSHRP